MSSEVDPGTLELQLGPQVDVSPTVDGRNPANQLIDSFSHDLEGFIHPRWCRISSINSIIHFLGGVNHFEPFVFIRLSNREKLSTSSFFLVNFRQVLGRNWLTGHGVNLYQDAEQTLLVDHFQLVSLLDVSKKTQFHRYSESCTYVI